MRGINTFEKQELAKHVFWKVKPSLLVDGSADYGLDIGGFSRIEIGDWIWMTWSRIYSLLVWIRRNL